MILLAKIDSLIGWRIILLFAEKPDSMQISTVPSVFVRALVDSAERNHFKIEHLLAQTGISPEIVGHEKARVPAESFSALTDAMIAEMQDEYCGLGGTASAPGTFAMMCYACIHCPTLGKFLQRSTRFHSIVTTVSKLELKNDGEFVRLVFTRTDTSSDPNHMLTMVILGVAHRLSGWLIGQNVPLQSASFSHPRPAHAASYNLMFQSPVYFDQEVNSLCFHSNYLDKPVKQDEISLEGFLQTPGLIMMASPDSSNSFVARVRDLIGGSAQSEFPEFEWIAEQFHTTTGTLRRRLRDEGTSYQQLKDDLRRDTAIFNLNRGHMSIEEVATSVGFAEPTSFFRAFKRWTGVTPRAYIRQSEDA